MVDCYEGEIELLDDLVVLTATGRTGLSSATQFRQDLDHAMEAGSGNVVLDLSDLELIDSDGLGILIAAAGRMMTEQRSLVLVLTEGHVLRVLAITGLSDSFSIARTRAEAIAKTSPRSVAEPA